MKTFFHSQNYKSLILGAVFLLVLSLPCLSQQYNYSQYNSGEILLSPWDWTLPPAVYNGGKVVLVDFDMDFEQVISVNEQTMVIGIKFVQYTSWNDPRLYFANNTLIPLSNRMDRIDLTEWRYQIWRPKITYSNMIEFKNITEKMFVYPNGKVTFYREVEIGISCDLRFQNMPSDSN